MNAIHFFARHFSSKPKPTLLWSVILSAITLSACAPLVLGSMVGSSLVVADRRTSGSQIEDQAIEIKAFSRIKEIMGDRQTPSVVSYNRVVLLMGVVSSETDKAKIEQVVSRIPNVRSVVNEISAQNISFPDVLHDSVITSKVKATFFDAKDLQGTAFKVATHGGTVYLMGRVTEAEAKRAAELARSISGVKKVVKVFEIVTETELIEMMPGRTPRSTTS